MSLKRVRSGVSLARLAVEAEAQAALSPRCITVDALKRYGPCVLPELRGRRLHPTRRGGSW